MHQGSLVHSAVRGDAARVRALAELYGALAQAVRASGPVADEARAAHAALGRRVCAWVSEDVERERADLVTPGADTRAWIEERIARALPWLDGEPASDEQRRRIVNAARRCPEALPRATLVTLRRCLDRLGRLETLRAPQIFLVNEARLIGKVLDWQRDGEITPVAFDPDDGFETTLMWAVKACILCEPGHAGGRDLGIGDAGAADHANADHPWARPPFVPGRGFSAREGLVASGFEDTTPLGWAAGDELAALAAGVRASAVTTADRGVSARLRGYADRLDEARREGVAVLAWLEYLSPESEGERIWLVE